MECLMTRHPIAPKCSELPQRESIGDARSQLAQIPVLDTLEEQGAQRLLGAQSAPSGFGPLEPAHQVAVNEIDDAGMPVEKGAQALEDGIENSLGDEFKVSEAPLSSCSRLPHPASSAIPISS
jgi:hypothetical protein